MGLVQLRFLKMQGATEVVEQPRQKLLPRVRVDSLGDAESGELPIRKKVRQFFNLTGNIFQI